ncbi:MAG: hypothetical protein Q8Q96_01125 [bacterium]|nr:hypothetical protein [bacterium]
MKKIHFAEEESWDVKKILIGILILFFLAGTAYAAKTFLFDKQKKAAVAGISVEREKVFIPTKSQSFFLPSQSDVQQKINEIRQDVVKLNVSEIASSSPQVQKIIDDIKSLQEYPRNQAKDICQQICSGL